MCPLVDKFYMLCGHWAGCQETLALHVSTHGYIEKIRPAYGLSKQTKADKCQLVGFLGFHDRLDR